MQGRPTLGSRSRGGVRLVALTRAVVDAIEDPQAVAALTGGRGLVADVMERVREVAAQDAAHSARTGRPPEWGGFLAIRPGAGPLCPHAARTKSVDADSLEARLHTCRDCR